MVESGSGVSDDEVQEESISMEVCGRARTVGSCWPSVSDSGSRLEETVDLATAGSAFAGARRFRRRVFGFSSF